jgi:hypothetical protein
LWVVEQELRRLGDAHPIDVVADAVVREYRVRALPVESTMMRRAHPLITRMAHGAGLLA